MKNVIVVYILSLFSIELYGQQIPAKSDILSAYGFVENKITDQKDEILFYSYQNGETKKQKLVLYLQGSDPSPLFSYSINEGKLNKYCFLKGDFQALSDEYLYVAVEKVGFEGLIDENNIPKPKIYQKKNSLDNRVNRAHRTIEYLDSIYNFSQIIVYGHSEGANVGARLAVECKEITHLGFWAGNVLPDFFDFALEVRKSYYQGEVSASAAQTRVDEIIAEFTDNIATDTANVEMEGYTNLRWWSYAEPALFNLTQLNIPLYVQVATEDESAPIESAYVLPLEFARLQKSNLSFNVCVGCNHSFQKKLKKGKVENKWREIFTNFIKWTQENP
ncbi:MAG: hypothetical protein AAFQ94_15555 [Bacteroidota bacterium]